jgi:tetratricopeptide (TPR) repeat protein
MPRIDQLLDQAAAARSERRRADARLLLVEAVDLCRQSGDRARLPMALAALGQAERDLHNLETARQHYQEAVDLCRAHGPVLRFAHTLRHLADIYRCQGHHGLAEPRYQEALDCYRKHPATAPLDLANTLRAWRSSRATLATRNRPSCFGGKRKRFTRRSTCSRASRRAGAASRQ